MAAEINPNLYPPDGYVFKEQDGSIHRGESWRDLERKVKAYRERNGIPPGDVWQEMMTQVCAKFPGHCRQQTPGNPTTSKTHSLTFNQVIMGWLAQAMKLKREDAWARVDDAEAARRAAICAVCPMQKSLNHACESCLTTVNRSRRALLDGRDPKFSNLNPCGALNEDCQSSVHAILEPSKDPNLPASCWRRG